MKARNYREVKGPPYTRLKYIHGSPQPKIMKFSMGDPSMSFEYKFSLIAERRVQIRHNALEAARVVVNHELQTKLGNSFYMRVLTLPHVILRENKMIFGAHADRLQDGMRRSFGKPIGRAARVEPGQPVITAFVNENGIEAAKIAMKRGEDKLPTPCRIVMEKIEKPNVEVEKVAS
jgi:large subunit ribosomal protein L10e